MTGVGAVICVAAALSGVAALRIAGRYAAWRLGQQREGSPVPGQWWDLYAHGPVLIYELTPDGVVYEPLRDPSPPEAGTSYRPGGTWQRRCCELRVFVEQAVRLPGAPLRRELEALEAARGADLRTTGPALAVLVEEEPDPPRSRAQALGA